MLTKWKVVIGAVCLILLTGVTSIGIYRNYVKNAYSMKDKCIGTFQMGDESVAAGELLAVMRADESDSENEYRLYKNGSGETISEGIFEQVDNSYAILYEDSRIYAILFYSNRQFYYYDGKDIPIRITKISNVPLI